MGQTYTKKKEKKKALRSHWLKSGLHFLSFCHVSPVTTSRTAIHQREGQPHLLPEDHRPPTVSTSSRSPWKPPTHPSSPVHQPWPWPILFPRRTQRLHQLPQVWPQLCRPVSIRGRVTPQLNILQGLPTGLGEELGHFQVP